MTDDDCCVLAPPVYDLLSYIIMTECFKMSWLKAECTKMLNTAIFHFLLPIVVLKTGLCPVLPMISVSLCFCGTNWRGARSATACKASARWCVLHVNHQMFLKRATGGGRVGRGEAGGRAATAGRVGWLPRGLGCHQEPWAQTADLAHTWTLRLSLGKNKADPICARWDELTALQNAQTGAIPSKQPFGSNNITGRCWRYQSSHNSGSVPCNERKVYFFLTFS